MNALMLVVTLSAMATSGSQPTGATPAGGKAAPAPFRMSGQSHNARRARGPIKIDGRIAERAWKAALPLGAFVDVADGKHDDKAVRAWVLWDEHNIYIGVQCVDENVTSTVASADVEATTEDSIEVLLHERGAPPGQLVVRLAANGAISEQGRRPARPGEAAAPARGAVRVQGTLDRSRDRDRGWSAEIAIPAAALVPPERGKLAWGDLWELNLVRVDRAAGKPARQLVWSRMFDRDPHAPDQAGDLRLADEKGEDPTSKFEAEEKERERERDRDKERQRHQGRR
jgi:hypothetical protein